MAARSDSIASKSGSKRWIKTQKRTFTRWINDKLRPEGMKVKDLEKDLDDGLVLIRLMETLAPRKQIPASTYHEKPSKKSHKKENLLAAFKFMIDSEDIPLETIAPDNILEHNMKAILELIWQLIVAYHLGEGGKKQQLLAKGRTQDQLLAWINAALPKREVSNFTSDWKDGTNLLALVNYCKPGVVPDDSVNQKKSLANIKRAMKLAEENFHIPALLDPEDLHEKPEERSVMTYVSYFCCPGSPGATFLLEWIQGKIPGMKVKNLTSDWSNGLALGALVNAVSKNGFPAYQDMKMNDPVENCRTVMEAAEDKLDIDKTVRPEEFANRKLSHLQRMVYLTQFPSVRLPPKVIEIQVPTRPGSDEKVQVLLDCPEGTDENMQLIARVKGETTGRVQAQVEGHSATQFKIEFLAEEEDVYNLWINYGENKVKGSPFVFNLGPPDPSRVHYLDRSNPVKVGDQVCLRFDTSEAGSGELTAKTRGERSKVVASELEAVPIGNYKLTFTAHLPDVYTVEVKLEGRDVEGSPFVFDFTNIANPAKVECGEASFDRVGEPVRLPVDVSKAGKGILRVEAKASDGEEAEVQINPSEDHPQEIVFIPFRRDQYFIRVYYEDVEIDASPLEVDLRPIAPQPGEISIAEPPDEAMRVGEEIRIIFNTASAGNGKMSANCRGQTLGEVPISVLKPSKGKHGVKFLPTAEDLYTINVFWTKTAIPGSPFTIDLIPKGRPEASKCEILNLQSTPRIVALGEKFTVEVESTDAGDGKLTAIAEGSTRGLETIHEEDESPDSDSISCSSDGRRSTQPVVKLISDDNPRKHSVTYIPTTVGVHKVQLLWSGKEVPGSPLRFESIVATTCAFGGPAILDLRTIHKRKNMKAYAVRMAVGESPKKKTQQLKVRIDKVMTGHFKLVCDLKELGIHYVHVFAKGSEIEGSPFVVNYTKAARPELCTVHGLLKIGWVGQPFEFTVDTTQAGDGELLVYRMVLNKGGSRMSSRLSSRLSTSRHSFYFSVEDLDPDFTVSNNRDGSKSVVYTPSSSGDVDIEVTFAGTPIPGSPFHLLIRNRSETDAPDVLSIDLHGKMSTSKSISYHQDSIEITGLDLALANYRVGIPHQFKLHCEDLGEGPPEITCKPQDAAEITVTPAPGRNSYWCEIVPLKSGKPTIAVKYDNNHIFGSPFHLKFKSAGNAQKCRLMETSAECQAAVKDNVVCCVSTEGAGKGKLTAAVQSCMTKSHLPVAVTLVRKHHYNIEFNPTQGSRYTLLVKYDDSHIQGSPFDIALGDPSKCRIEGDGLTYAQVNKESRFMVYTEAAGPGVLEVDMQEGEDQVLPTSVAEIADHEYEVSYIPQHGGIHVLYILWGGVEVPGSPFTVTCVDPAEFTLEQPFKETCVGMEVKLTVTTEVSTTEDKLTLHLLGLGESDTKGTVHRIQDGTYSCSVTPPGIGKYEGHIMWGGEHISGSPFKLEVELPPQPEEFTVDATELDVTTLGVRVRGPKRCLRYGKICSTVANVATKENLSVAVTQSTEDWCDLEFHPEPGQGIEYVLNIQYEGKSIRGSPFTLISTDASQCYSKGKGLRKAGTTDWNSFTVYTENAGRGELGVFILREDDNTPIDPSIDQRNETEYLVKYIPVNHGFHSISVKWGNHHIPGSPFRVYCSNPAMFHLQKVPREICLGESVEVSMPADEGAEESKYLRILARSRNKPDVTGRVYKVDNGLYSCSVSPNALGKYLVHVQCNGYEVDGSPFKIRVMRPPVPENVRIYGQGIQDGRVDEEGQFTIDVSDAGHGYVSFKVHGPKRSFKINMCHHPELDNAILAQYNPSVTGNFTISVLWANVHVPGSPFKVKIHEPLPHAQSRENSVCNMKPPKAEKCIVSGPDFPFEFPDQVKLTVDTNAAGPGCLQAKLVSDSQPSILVDVKQTQPKVYLLSFKPQTAEVYSLSVTWGGENVPGSPFEIDLSPAKPNAVTVKDPPSATVKAGEPIKVTFGTHLAGLGQLTATCTSTNNGEVPVCVTRSKSPTPKYDVELTPQHQDVYSLSIMWAGEHVKGSPFNINLIGQEN